MNLLIRLIESPWFWLDVCLSVLGGIIVWRGLQIEKNAEKLLPPESFKSDIFGDIVEKYKLEMERGWRVLMRGIIIEVVAALGISIISGLENADLNNRAEQAIKDAAMANELAATNELQVEEAKSNNLVLQQRVLEMETNMASLDVGKWPIFSISADVRLEVTMVRRSESEKGFDRSDWQSDLNFPSRLEVSESSSNRKVTFSANTANFMGFRQGPTYALPYPSPIPARGLFLIPPPSIIVGQTAMMAAEEIDKVSLTITGFQMTNAELVNGTATILINGRLKKMIRLKPAHIENGIADIWGICDSNTLVTVLGE